MKNLKIEIPKGYEIDKEKSTFENIVLKEVKSKLDKIFEYHKTTQEQFDKQYENLPKNIKAIALETLVVAFYNKGWKPNWKDTDERKWYLWFYLDNFRLAGCSYYCSGSTAPTSLHFKSKEDALKAFEEYPEVFETSRTTNFE